MITRQIPIRQWLSLAREGAAPPITITLEGDSMRPLIRRGKDPVTIIPLQRPLKKGDVVLFHLGEKYIVHRVWKLKPGLVQTFGDHCWNPEPWFPQEQVLGQVVRYQRSGRMHHLDTPAARAWGLIWMALHPARRMYFRFRHLAGKILKKLLKGEIRS